MNGRGERSNVIAFDPHLGTRTGWEIPARIEQLRRDTQRGIDEHKRGQWRERVKRAAVFVGIVLLLTAFWGEVISWLMR